MYISNKVNASKAQHETRQLVVLVDIVTRYMTEPNFASETRNETLSYLAEKLVEQTLEVEAALEAYPQEPAVNVEIPAHSI